MKITLDDVRAFCYLADPDRETFVEYVNKIDGKRPQYYITKFLWDKGATGEALDLFQNSNYLGQIHGNYRKSALLNGPGQAIMEATILAGMCKSMTEVSQSAKLVDCDCTECFLEFSGTCGMRVVRELEQLPISLFESDPVIHKVMSSLESSYATYSLTEKTIKHILECWKEKPTRVYDLPYTYFLERVKNNG